MKALVVGGSGYLGQFVVEDLVSSLGAEVAVTHHSSAAPSTFPPNVKPYWVNLATGEGIHDAVKDFGPFDVAVNCVAISSPAACEKDTEAARAVNVPRFLLEALEWHRFKWSEQPLLIHISTDQVYDGSKALWQEDDTTAPVNSYGRTKREAEVAVQDRWPNHVILRSSIIYGPQCSTPVSRMLFLQFIVSSLEEGKPTAFFVDEFRSPIYVKDILAIIRAAIEKRDSLPHRLYNMGGPQRLSRLDMALAVADAYSFDRDASIIPVPSASVSRGVDSPADISMNVSRLQELGVPLTTFSDALAVLKDKLLKRDRVSV